MGRASRSKGARGERMLRDELQRHGWSDVSREGWKQVKGGQEACDDVVGRPPGYGSTISFENKFYKTGFDKYYALVQYFLLTSENDSRVCYAVGQELFVVALDPNKVLESASFPDVKTFNPKIQKVMLSLAKKCRDWAGNAQILSLKQNGKPFLYCRYRK